MPIYEYRCNKCGESFEKLVIHSDNEKVFMCDLCGSRDISRIISSFAKGSSGTGVDFGSMSSSSSCGNSSSGFS